MNHQPIHVLSRLAISWGSLRTSLSALLFAFALASCGGSADQTIVTANGNTPLLLSNFTGLKGYTVGTSQVYSATVKDPDGISSVSVKLDGENIPVTVVGDVYSVTLPTTIAVGTHSIIFTARGKGADGTLEVPVSEGVNFTVFKNNTPLSIGAVQGFAAYTLGTAQTYFTDVVDPDGISGVTATFNGQPIAVNTQANRYSVIIPATAAAGNNTLRFEGIGKQPDAVNEAPQSSQIAFIIYPNNTGLVAGNIAGLSSYTVGGSQTYSLTPVDPDGITSVTATLDGANVILGVTGNTFSFSTPTILSIGSHAISFTAVGKQPNGSGETAVVVSQNITVLANNTLLSLGTISGPASYTIGTAQAYSTTATDPDGIVSVTATLDGSPISVVPSNGTYSITLPTTVLAGTHTIAFTGVGRRPDGSSETAVTVSRQIQVLPNNTALSLGNITGLASYVLGATPSYTSTIVDPDGINSVSATLDGSPIGTSNNGSTYSVTAPSTLTLGQHTLVIRAQGTTPGGGLETQQTTSLTFTVLAANTPLSLSAISGAATIPLNSIGTYSVTVTDPDGISSVSATIDGANANVTNNGSSYSVQTPSYQAPGSHTVVFTATGQIPGGGTETAQQVSRSFSAQTPNTVINISAISGPANFTIGQASQYTFSVVDPDGVVSVSATLNGQSISVGSLGNNSYGVTIPSVQSAGFYTLTIQAVGTVPGAGTENAQPQSINFNVLPINTPLTMSVVSDQIVGNFRQWNCTIVEPDGNPNVTASFNGANQVVVKVGNVYSFSTAATAPAISVVFTAIGVQPDGSAEGSQTSTYVPPSPN